MDDRTGCKSMAGAVGARCRDISNERKSRDGIVIPPEERPLLLATQASRLWLGESVMGTVAMLAQSLKPLSTISQHSRVGY